MENLPEASVDVLLCVLQDDSPKFVQLQEADDDFFVLVSGNAVRMSQRWLSGVN